MGKIDVANVAEDPNFYLVSLYKLTFSSPGSLDAMSDSTISLKPISGLLTDVQGIPTRFWIAAYQRGYRWSPLQVTQLLDDVWDFIQASKGKKDEPTPCSGHA
jgi:hypothetical protein